MLKYVEAEDADILILTETKCADPKLKELEERYEVSFFLSPIDRLGARLTDRTTAPLLGR